MSLQQQTAAYECSAGIITVCWSGSQVSTILWNAETEQPLSYIGRDYADENNAAIRWCIECAKGRGMQMEFERVKMQS
jgi:hypothetical protein